MNTFERIQQQSIFSAPVNWRRVETIDMHTGGEPLRVVLSGFPDLEGQSVLDRRRFVKQHHDDFRMMLMNEPRGHADMYGCVLTPPNTITGDGDQADFGVIFMHNEGYSTMCGHAIIAISKLAVEMDWVPKIEGTTKLKIDAPCGRIESFVDVSNGAVTSVRFHCVPSFVVQLDQSVSIPGLGNVNYDLAFGGAFYAYVDMVRHQFEFDLSRDSYQALISAGRSIKKAVQAADSKIVHPFEEDLSFLYGVIFVGRALHGNDSRNVCVFADGEVDRCPTGSGVSGRMAIHFAKGEIQIGDTHTVESITDSVFTGSVVRSCKFGPHDAVVPQVEGDAFVTGRHTFVLDPGDPMGNGFLLR